MPVDLASQRRTTSGNSSRGARGLRSSHIDPAALMRIKNLELRAKLVVDGFLSGLHRSPYHGFSVEFTEYRQYSPGDDLRFLDWRLFARSDRFYLKRFEDETNLRCYLLVDLSRSMSYGSLAYDKATYAKTATAAHRRFFFPPARRGGPDYLRRRHSRVSASALPARPFPQATGGAGAVARRDR